jgi:hypothetical protein
MEKSLADGKIMMVIKEKKKINFPKTFAVTR